MSARQWKSFSEAACLYAQNAEIVETMYREFHRDLCAFVDAVRDELEELLGGKLVESNGESDRTTRLPRVRYWWIDGSDAFLTVETYDPTAIAEKRLWLGVSATNATGRQLAAMRAVANQAEFESYCQPARDGRTWFLRVIVPLIEPDPVSNAAMKIADAMQALHKAEQAAK